VVYSMSDFQKKGVNREEKSFLSLCHDLKAPLQTMLGFNAINQDKINREIIPAINSGSQEMLFTVQQVKRNVDIISREGARLSGMIENLLDFYCLEQDEVHYHMEPCRVPELMEEISSVMKAVCETKNLQWKVTYEKSLPFALLDRHWIIRVLENLISNAVKYTDSGTISCHVSALDGKIKFVIEDTGAGIPLRFYDQIFDKFVKAPVKGVQKGSGLGLAICRSVIESHGGEIWFESQVGKGTTFSFTVPAV